jgi:hypothetical protein
MTNGYKFSKCSKCSYPANRARTTSHAHYAQPGTMEKQERTGMNRSTVSNHHQPQRFAAFATSTTTTATTTTTTATTATIV